MSDTPMVDCVCGHWDDAHYHHANPLHIGKCYVQGCGCQAFVRALITADAASAASARWGSRNCECGHYRGDHRADDGLDVWYECAIAGCSCKGFAWPVRLPAVDATTGAPASVDSSKAVRSDTATVENYRGNSSPFPAASPVVDAPETLKDQELDERASAAAPATVALSGVAPTDERLRAMIAHGESFAAATDDAESRELLSALRQLVVLRTAARALWDRYGSAPDGILGCGLVNDDFFRVRDALDVSASKPDTPSDDPPRAADATPSEDSRWLLGYVAGGPKWVARFVEHESSMGDGIYYKHIVPIETTDANEALAFCRERDAKAILESVDYPYRVILRPEEHIWDSAPVRSDWSLIDSLSARKLADSNEINSLRAQLGSLTGALEEARRDVAALKDIGR